MKGIAHHLNTYMQTNPFDSGDSECETILDQFYQAYVEFHQKNHAETGVGLLP